MPMPGMTQKELRQQLSTLVGETVKGFAARAWGSDDEDLKELHIRFANGARLQLTALHFRYPDEPSIVPEVIPSAEAICAVPSCTNAAQQEGFCRPHYLERNAGDESRVETS